MIDVNAILFKAANECRSYEETRYYLNGVFVQPHPVKGVVLTATDGHRLLCVHDESGICDKAAIIHVETKALTAVKTDKKNPEPPRLAVDADGHAIVGTYRSIKSAVIDGTYPDYPRVLTPIVLGAQKKVFAPASFKHEYLAGFSKVASILSGSMDAIRIVTFSESDPALILFQGCASAFGVLMPMRSSIGDAMPAFMKPILDPIMKPADPPQVAPAAAKAKPKAKPTTSKRRPISKRKVSRSPKKAAKRRAA